MDSDQTARMRRLVWIHAGRKRTMFVLSWRGSNDTAVVVVKGLLQRILFYLKHLKI
jgi:hypothetical protein